MKNSGSQTKSSERNFTKRLKKVEGRTSSLEDKVEEMNQSVKENVKSRITHE